MKLTKNYPLLIAIIAIPVIIYFYFLKWKTNTAYGDDLYVFRDYSSYQGLSGKIGTHVVGAKYRPIHDFVLGLSMLIFQKNLVLYYLFNISIQIVNTYLFALILNLFLKSPFYSLLFSLIVGLSRFSFFSVTQIVFGGSLEGLAITFFLCSLFFILRVFVNDDLDVRQKRKGILWSIFFANLSIYTHERYIILFPFLLLAIAFFPSLKMLTKKHKVNLSLVAIGSILLNVAIKKYIYDVPFFMGTASAEITFSFSTAISFLTDGISSIFLVNSGPEYLTGVPFSALPKEHKIFVLLIDTSIVALLLYYLSFVFTSYKRSTVHNATYTQIASIYKLPDTYVSKHEAKHSNFAIIVLLAILFGLLLLPAVVTIRLEQRWLQGPFIVFILMIAIAFYSLQFKKGHLKNYVFLLFIALSIMIDYTYLKMGAGNIYLKHAEAGANMFLQAIDKKTIPPSTTKLFVWEKIKDPNGENEIKWTLAEGYFFEFYQGRTKQMVFVDSVYQKLINGSDTSLQHFNKNTDQVVYIKNNAGNYSVIDITNEYLKDSLKSFNP